MRTTPTAGGGDIILGSTPLYAQYTGVHTLVSLRQAPCTQGVTSQKACSQYTPSKPSLHRHVKLFPVAGSGALSTQARAPAAHGACAHVRSRGVAH